jgi:hypothetical protein
MNIFWTTLIRFARNCWLVLLHRGQSGLIAYLVITLTRLYDYTLRLTGNSFR